MRALVVTYSLSYVEILFSVLSGPLAIGGFWD